jgi:hypothetical protein
VRAHFGAARTEGFKVDGDLRAASWTFVFTAMTKPLKVERVVPNAL